MWADVRLCFAPLLQWVLSFWQGTALVIAVDPTTHQDLVVSLAVSVPQLCAARGLAHRAGAGVRRRLGGGVLRTAALAVTVGASGVAGLSAVRPRAE